MPTVDVVYLLCARELGLLAVDTTRDDGLALDFKATDEVSAKTDFKLKRSLAEKYAGEGELAAARAAAIRHCITRAGGEVSPTTETAVELPAAPVVQPVQPPSPTATATATQQSQ